MLIVKFAACAYAVLRHLGAPEARTVAGALWSRRSKIGAEAFLALLQAASQIVCERLGGAAPAADEAAYASVTVEEIEAAWRDA